MAENTSAFMKEAIGFIGEAFAIIHYFSDIMFVLTFYNIIFEHGAVAAVIIWIIAAVLSAIISELLRSRLPTPLRIVFRRKKIQ